jgi:hypothetical protein
MDSRKLAFLHIPKTGGTYVGSVSLYNGIRYLGHTCVINQDGKASPHPIGTGIIRTIRHQEISKYYVFSIVRNIFEWLVSYAGHAGGWNPQYRDLNHYDYKNTQKGFEYLIKTISDRDGNIWPNRKSIFFQLFCDNGKLIADRLLRTETLDADLSMMAFDFNLRIQKKPKQRVGIHADYRTYYTDSLIELVQNTWGKELQMYGYTFEGCTESHIPIGKTIDKKLYFL